MYFFHKKKQMFSTNSLAYRNGITTDNTFVWSPSVKSSRLPGSINSKLPHVLKTFACGIIKDQQSGHDWILTVGGHMGSPPISQMIYYFDVQDNTQWKVLKAKAYQPDIHGSIDNTIPSAWNSFPTSSNSLLQFGASKFTIATGYTFTRNESPDNLAVWQDELGVFVWSSNSLTKGRVRITGRAKVPLVLRVQVLTKLAKL